MPGWLGIGGGTSRAGTTFKYPVLSDDDLHGEDSRGHYVWG